MNKIWGINGLLEILVRQRTSFNALDKLGLTEGQTRVVDQAIAENNHCGAIYGAVPYRCGMEDGNRL